MQKSEKRLLFASLHDRKEFCIFSVTASLDLDVLSVTDDLRY